MTIKTISNFDNLKASQNSIEELYRYLGYKKDLNKFPITKHLALVEEIKLRYAKVPVKQIRTSKDSYDLLQFVKWEEVEHFYVIFLCHNGNVIKFSFIYGNSFSIFK